MFTVYNPDSIFIVCIYNICGSRYLSVIIPMSCGYVVNFCAYLVLLYRKVRISLYMVSIALGMPIFSGCLTSFGLCDGQCLPCNLGRMF